MGAQRNLSRMGMARLVGVVLCAVFLAGCGDAKLRGKDRGSLETTSLPADTPAAREARFPGDPSLPYARIGVFIGIAKYPRVKPLDGSINDATAMQRLFADHFGCKRSVLLAETDATRDNILKTLDMLVAEVRAALKKVKPGKRVTAVIFYAGHGQRVRDQARVEDGKDEDDQEDETWVAYDSSISGEQDVRDDEIDAVIRAILELGANVLLISDSCYSGTVHRSLDFAKSRSIRRGPDADGPALYRFRNVRGRGAGKADLIDRDRPPGFVVYTACRDDEKAKEDVDDAGEPCGRLTKVLRALLPTIAKDATYASLHRQIAAEFDKRWPDRLQTPQFHASSATRDRLFLQGDYPVPHAEIASRSDAPGKLKLSMGWVHGVTEGAAFAFYRNVHDLARKANRLAVGQVESVSRATCVVQLPEGGNVPDSAKARPDILRFEEFRAYVETELPEAMAKEVRLLAKNRQITLASKGEPCAIVVRHDPVEKRIRLFSPAALPSPHAPTGSRPVPLRELEYAAPEAGARLLSKHLLFMARVTRLMSLSYNEDDLHCSIADVRRGGKTPQPVVRKDGDAVSLLRAGDRFSIAVKNNTGRPVYVTVFAFDAESQGRDRANLAPVGLDVLYPVATEEAEQVADGGVLKVPGFRALAGRRLERTALKVVATSEFISFRALIRVPPTSDLSAARSAVRSPFGVARGNRRSAEALFLLVRDVVLGGEIRSGDRRTQTGSAHWATSTQVFDVAQKGVFEEMVEPVKP